MTLRLQRQALGISQSRLSRLSSVSRFKICMHENEGGSLRTEEQDRIEKALQAELDRLGFSAKDRILNAAPERGMFSSIRCAAQWCGWRSDLTHWAIVLGDQTHISCETLQTILDFSAVNPERCCLPKQGGHRRHPVVLPRQGFAQLANSELIDLKSFLDSLRIPGAICELDDPALELDLDTPEDYDRAVSLYSPIP